MKKNMLTIGVIFLTILVMGIIIYIQADTNELAMESIIPSKNNSEKIYNEDVNDRKIFFNNRFLNIEKQTKIK